MSISRILINGLLICLGASPLTATNQAQASQQTISGAGATFPYPLYSKWVAEYQKKDPETAINYQAIGSGGGIRQITERTVDFGASDAPMTDEQMAKLATPIVHIPTTLGAVVLTYNLPGVATGLKLTPEILSDLFMGRIQKWNDPRLTTLNPGIKLPDQAVTIVHRTDGSGTTYVFTDYLSNVSPPWQSTVGKGPSVKWPAGIGGKGNEGVTGMIKQTPGSIGYVELAFAETNKLPVVTLKNKSGTFVAPTLASISEAAAGALKNIPEDFRVSLVNAAGKSAYPLTSFSYLLVYKNMEGLRGKKIVNFIWWAIHDGQQYSENLLYAKLPPILIPRIEKALRTLTVDGKLAVQ